MMVRSWIALFALTAVFSSQSQFVFGQQDAKTLEKRYGTHSPEALDYFQIGVKSYQNSEYEKCLKEFQSALKIDPGFQLGMYWLAQAYEAVGEHEQEMDVYVRLFESRNDEWSKIVVEGCLNAGLAEGKRGNYESSEFWLGRALMLDPENKFNLMAPIYRNLTITKFQKKDFSSAVLTSSIGNRIDPEKVPEGMVNTASNKAKREVATVIAVPTNSRHEFKYQPDLGQTGETKDVPKIDENIRQLVDISSQKKMLAIPKDQKYYYLIDYSKKRLATKKVKVQGRIQGATFVNEQLFVSVTSPNRIAVLEPKTGKDVHSWPLKDAAPASIAAAPEKGVAFFCSGGVIRILDLSTGEISLSDYEATGIASDPTGEFVYGYRVPPSKSNTQRGQILVRGKPIYFTIDNEEFSWTQSTLFRFVICETKQLLLAQARINAASNAKKISVSPDGKIVALVGGGGWRPLDKASGVGYGIAYYNASDFEHVLRFIETDAYPNATAISESNQLIFAQGGQTKLSHSVNDDEQKLEIGQASSVCFSSDDRWLFAAVGQKLLAIPITDAEKD